MRLHVLFFGLLRDRFGSGEHLEQFPGSTVAELLQYYRAVSPELGGLWDSIAVAVNQRYASAATLLSDGDEVALLPPVSGGSDAEGDSRGELVASGTPGTRKQTSPSANSKQPPERSGRA